MPTRSLSFEIRGASRSPELRSLMRRRLTRVLDGLRGSPIAVRASFTDLNGPKGGQADRCVLSVGRPRRPAVRAEHTAASQRTAFDGALAALERAIRRGRERERDLRRFPKKYFVASRVVSGRMPRRAAATR
ncbi:MAG TPA: HPF/RaiA family ribosome-associated protein [Methylomirabilota bacterium]|nr:HPF/RaiA family ribosome-associated protein [Methylomirabilota bacterium]